MPNATVQQKALESLTNSKGVIMGFWDTLGSAAKSVGKGMLEQAEKMNQEKQHWQQEAKKMSDDKLLTLFDETPKSQLGKISALKEELENRGYALEVKRLLAGKK